MPKRITVTKESSTGRNQEFHDNFKNKNMNRQEFVREIKNGHIASFISEILME